MTTMTQKITVPPDRLVWIKLPDEVPTGEAEVRVEINPAAPSGKRGDIKRWLGALSDCQALKVDLVEWQRSMRDEWPD